MRTLVRGLLKRDADTRADVAALHRAIRRATRARSAAPENIAEDVAENIAEIRTVEIKALGAEAAASVKRGHAELIVLPALVFIRQNRVCLGCLLEFFRRILVSRIHIRMIFLGKHAVCLLDVLLRGVL